MPTIVPASAVWWDRLSARQQEAIQRILLAAGVLSIAIPLSAELVGFVLRLRRRRRQGNTNIHPLPCMAFLLVLLAC